jgi:hypothetical protein
LLPGGAVGQAGTVSTSGGGWLNAVLFVLVIALSVQIAAILLNGRRPTVSVAAVGLWLLVAVPSVVQIPFPPLLTSLRRDPELVRDHGQVWRVLTSVLVQDGGVAGTVFNLVILAVIAVLAVAVWGPARAAIVFLLAHLVFNTAAVIVSPDVGAGNSGATLGLAASLAALAVLAPPAAAARWPVTARAAGVLVAGIALILIGDAHGIAVLGGLLIGALIASTPGTGRNLWQTRQHHAPG